MKATGRTRLNDDVIDDVKFGNNSKSSSCSLSMASGIIRTVRKLKVIRAVYNDQIVRKIHV